MTTEAKTTHTPGPWVCAAKTPDMIRIGPENQPMDNGYAFLADIHGRERESNARLIAAAPDLLAACKEATNIRVPLQVAESLGGSGISKDLANAYEHLRAAIAKAQGTETQGDNP